MFVLQTKGSVRGAWSAYDDETTTDVGWLDPARWTSSERGIPWPAPKVAGLNDAVVAPVPGAIELVGNPHDMDLLLESVRPACESLAPAVGSPHTIDGRLPARDYSPPTCVAGLSVRRPTNAAWRRLPPAVHSVNATWSSSRGVTHVNVSMSSAVIPSPQRPVFAVRRLTGTPWP